MARVNVEVVHAFVDGGQGGNPAGVVLEGDALSPEQRQRVAALVGLSETTFVGRSERADIQLSFHTPSRFIPHCGHATVAAFARLCLRHPRGGCHRHDGGPAGALAGPRPRRAGRGLPYRPGPLHDSALAQPVARGSPRRGPARRRRGVAGAATPSRPPGVSSEIT